MDAPSADHAENAVLQPVCRTAGGGSSWSMGGGPLLLLPPASVLPSLWRVRWFMSI